MAKKSIGVGLLGLGTVGRGVYRILTGNMSGVEQKVGVPVEIKKILVRDKTRDRGVQLDKSILTEDFNDIINNPDIDIVVEVMGGIKPTLSYALKALEHGKSLVTANKDMLAEHGKELFEAAEKHNCDLLFEASVAGGIPIIRPLKESLAANRIRQVMGIVNGTTNYMLTRMSKEGLDFQTALANAQALGYAEADPTSDIEGYDAARKVAILASIAFNTRVSLEQVYVEGITRITTEDISYAGDLNYEIKLLGIAKEDETGIEVRVHPAMLPKQHPLAAVNDVYNAVFVNGDAVGNVMFFGPGAGELPTASAVAGDIISAARSLLKDVPGLYNCTCYDEKPVKPMGLTSTKYYIRLNVVDRPGVLAGIADVFGNNNVSLAAVIQKDTDGQAAILVLVTHEVLEQDLQKALQVIKELPTVNDIANVIRVEE